MTVGQRIKQRRKALKISADDLGKMLGKDRSTIFRYENGDIEKMPIDMLEPIAKALQTTPQFLMGWEDAKKNNDAIADIVVRLRSDRDFFEAVMRLKELDEKKLTLWLELLK